MTPDTPPDADASRSLVRVLVRIVVDALALLLPFVIPLVLPVGLMWIYLAGAMVAQWVEHHLRGAVDVTWLWWLGACVGASVAVGRQADAVVAGVLMGGGAFVALLLLGRAWEKIARLSVAHDDPGPTLTRVAGVERPSRSAWLDTGPLTPEGGRLRIVGCHEPRNSAPLQYDYLFPDGSVVFRAGASTGFSPDGRYFVSPMPTTGWWGLLIYDRHAQCIYRCDKVETFVDIHAVTQTHVQGWGSRVEQDNRMLSASLDDLIAHSVREPMVEMADLRLPQSQAEHIRRQQEVELPAAPPGAPSLVLAPHLPACLMTRDDPLDPLFAPWLEPIVDDRPSGLLVSARHSALRWGDTGQTLTCLARPKGSDEAPRHWRWSVQQGWNAVAQAPEERA
ncbi:hypothetical protein [Xanthomonas cannabis]|uniref:hypothetical protein n=1 Tax=Xanthomonas cannabis TaxID=1885674 RepID=UPI001FBAAE9A|nr:hypothetical protein [Xanthomonas cannabis]NIK18642.1 hypothetical protein [Xanthomonas cannabis]